MTAKEYLKQYRTLDEQIRAKTERAALWRQRAEYVSPVGIPGNGSIRDKVGDTAVKIADLEREINADIDALVDLESDITSRIKAVSRSNRRQVLELHYLNGLSLDEVAQRMNYSYRQICRIHGEALLEISCP